MAFQELSNREHTALPGHKQPNGKTTTTRTILHPARARAKAKARAKARVSRRAKAELRAKARVSAAAAAAVRGQVSSAPPHPRPTTTRSRRPSRRPNSTLVPIRIARGLDCDKTKLVARPTEVGDHPRTAQDACYPPFDLRADERGINPYFDGRVLAAYSLDRLLSSSDSAPRATREECVRLDAYLKQRMVLTRWASQWPSTSRRVRQRRTSR